MLCLVKQSLDGRLLLSVPFHFILPPRLDLSTASASSLSQATRATVGSLLMTTACSGGRAYGRLSCAKLVSYIACAVC